MFRGDPATNEWAIRDTARTLAGLYRELDAKHTQQAPRGQRVMKPSPGPRDPAPAWAVSLDPELTARLFEMVRDACNHIQPTKILNRDGGRLAAWIAWHAYDVAQLDFAGDLLDELQDQARTLTHKLYPQGVTEVAKRPEPRQLAEVICQRPERMGHKVTREQLRQWASRGHITSELRSQRATYLMTEILSYLHEKTGRRRKFIILSQLYLIFLKWNKLYKIGPWTP